MKKILPILLLLMLLCGCNHTQTTEPTDEATQPTQAVVINTYVADSDVEKQTDGAVRQYNIEKEKVDWIAPFNGGVLVATTGPQTTLYVVSGQWGQIVATTTIPVKLTANSIWQTTDSGCVYYIAEERQMVFLDAALKEVKRLQLPDTMIGDPAIEPDGSEIFYSVDQTIYAMDTELRIVRPVRINTCEEQTLLGCYLNGAAVGCSVRDADGNWKTLYISGENGELLYRNNNLKHVYSYGNTYFALLADGAINQYIYGDAETTPLQLNILDEDAYGVPELGGVVGKTITDQGVQLSFYNMKKTGVVTLPQDVKMAAGDASEQSVWLLSEYGTLLRWLPTESAVEEDIDYTGAVYTAEAPDVEGLKQCAQRGDAIGKECGVVVRVYERSLVSNQDYDIQVEYQTPAINRALDTLETLLKRFPSKFLDKSVKGQIRICIVRSIAGEFTSAYHWYDGDPFIILSAGMDVEKAFLDAFANILDTHILDNSSLVDAWDALNPEGFSYNGETTIMAYLEGENRAFADRKGMRSAEDDRASIFCHAMGANNAEMFQTEIMQEKLKTLCAAIRDAWDLERSGEVFPWEQYLQ